MRYNRKSSLVKNASGVPAALYPGCGMPCTGEMGVETGGLGWDRGNLSWSWLVGGAGAAMCCSWPGGGLGEGQGWGYPVLVLASGVGRGQDWLGTPFPR